MRKLTSAAKRSPHLDERKRQRLRHAHGVRAVRDVGVVPLEARLRWMELHGHKGVALGLDDGDVVAPRSVWRDAEQAEEV
jgi:hypothetical protein